MARKKQFKLSVLIPTLPARISTFTVVLNNLRDQIKAWNLENDVEILALMDCKSMSVGDKRNKLIEMSSGEYIVFVDDDDNIPPYYLKDIIEATATKPDVVGINGLIKFEDGTPDRKFTHSIEYKRDIALSETHVCRPPNHLNPIKRSIAFDVKFPNQTYGEDRRWAFSILERIKTEVMLPKLMYVYFAYGSKSQSSPDCALSHI